MNARGVMGIILGLLALQNHVISEAMFVAIVIMSVVTSMIAGPAMRLVLRLRKRRQLADYITSKSFAGWIKPTDRREAIEALCRVAASNDVSADVILEAVLAREGTMPTGIGNGVAIPHARIEGLQSPILVLGLSAAGIDFDAPDGEPSHVIILILCPIDDDGVQLQILADIARTFSSPAARREFLKVNTYTELLATLRSTAHTHE
jgi:mannitol/fructose-specific phosphotransferase system IIA component (Ntr-type)